MCIRDREISDSGLAGILGEQQEDDYGEPVQVATEPPNVDGQKSTDNNEATEVEVSSDENEDTANTDKDVEAVEASQDENTEEAEDTSGGYSFEPSPEEVLEDLIPKYMNATLFGALLNSSTSEHASRMRAMKAATENAEDLIKVLTRESNQARQAEITTEISEIVGGAEALAE